MTATPGIDRRTFLASAAVGLLATACGSAHSATSTRPPTSPPTSPAPIAPSTTVPAPTHFVATGPETARRVALTFHTDGDLGLADQLLAVLAARNVHITSFVVGQWLDANPTWARRLTDAGHEVANHTYTHPTFGALSPQGMLDEITRCRDVLVRLTGQPGRYFRPSGTSDGTVDPGVAALDAAHQAGYPTVLGFDVDPLDYNQPGAGVVVQRVLAQAKPGSIVSLHFGYPGTIAALPGILDGLAERQLTPVTASGLLGPA